MPKNITIKRENANPIEAVLGNDLVKDPSISAEQVFDEQDTTMVIKTITIEGQIKSYPSPLEIIMQGEDCTITIEYDTPQQTSKQS